MPPRRKTPEELQTELKQIYIDQDGAMPDFTKLEGKPSSRLKSILVGLGLFCAVLGAVSWVGFFLFMKPTGFTGEGIVVKIESVEQLTSGGEAELVIRYRNEERLPIASSSLTATLPKGFVYLSSEPARSEDGRWLIGSIPPGAEGEVKVKGWIRAEVGATLTAQASLNYRPADFNSEFQKVASHSVAVGDSLLTMTGTGPETMTPGDKIEFRYEFENGSGRDIEQLRFVLEPLEGFIFDSAEPVPDAGFNDRWSIPKLAAGQKDAFVIRGTFGAASRGPKSLGASIGFVDGDVYVASARGSASTDVQKSDLAVNLIVNGSNQPPAVSFADTLHFSMNYKNAGDVVMQDVVLSAELPSEPSGAELIDWVSLKDELSGTRKGSVVSWNKKQIEGLAELKPGEEGVINFSVQLSKKPPFAEASGDKPLSMRFAVAAQGKAKIGRMGKTIRDKEILSDPLNIVLNSDVIFKAFGRYFDESGAPLGSGPLPLKVGETTVYRIHWVIQNTLHELTNLNVSTLLPQGVKWTGIPRVVEAGELTFDETGRKANWRLNRLPTSVPSVTVSFDVEVKPGFEDIGNILDLTGDSRFEAVDKETGSVILKTQPPVGTDLLGDTGAAGKGVVGE
jgi:hypothetical protein